MAEIAPGIELDPQRCHGKPVIKDTRVPVTRVLAAIAGGLSFEDVEREYGVTATRVEGLTGVWVGRDKLAAIGVRIARWVTSHGFALNVSTNLAHFGLIVPCGISEKGVTSIEQLIGRSPEMADVESAVCQAFASVFDCCMVCPATSSAAGLAGI